MPNYCKYILVCLICVLSSLSIKSQNVTDSLKGALENTSKNAEKAQINLEIGEYLLETSPEQAMQYYKAARVLAEELQDTAILMSCLLGICDIHSSFGENKDAINLIYLALDLAKNNPESLALCYNRMSILYYQLGNPEKSFESDLQSLKYNQVLNDSAGIAFDMHNIGTYYMGKALFDSAMYYYQQSNLMTPKSDKTLPTYNTSRMGLIYYHTEKYQQAIKEQLKAIEAFSQNGMQIPLANEKTYIADSYFKLKDYKNAAEYSKQSLDLAKELSHINLLIKNYTMLMDISRVNNDFEKALDYSLLINSYSDSISAKNNTNLIQNLETKHKYTEQKRLLELSEAKNEFLLRQKKLYSILSVLAILTFSIGIAFIIILLRNRNTTKKLLRKLNFANDSKSKLLSLTGHDLRNSIGTLKGFTDLLAANDISEDEVQQLMPKFVSTVDSSYDLLDNLVTWGKQSQEGLKPNVELLHSNQLIDETIKHVQQSARIKNIAIKNNNQPFEFNGDRNMILTVIRNLVSNAIKFSQPNTTITILTNKNNSGVEFSIKDEGIGLSHENIEKILNPNIDFNSKGTFQESGSGLGLNLCQSFIKGHGGSLSVESELQKGSTFKFNIPEKMAK